MSFKGIRYAHSPTGNLRWEPPVPFTSSEEQDATTLGPSCVQQITSNLSRELFNTPPPPESEDCLFLNVWAPSDSDSTLKPVLFWIYGGGLAFGTASLPIYDGTSLATNQDIVVVTINYRTNIFGFPSSSDLPLEANNLGFLDQELALKWVQNNIANFGGDPKKVAIMGESAGSLSVAAAIVRHTEDNPPFRAAVMLSGTTVIVDSTPVAELTAFNTFATTFGCTQAPGAERLLCLRAIPANAIHDYVNQPSAGSFTGIVDDSTLFDDSLGRITARQSARVPVLLGNMQDDGSLFALQAGAGSISLDQFLDGLGVPIPAGVVRALYPGQNDSQVIASVFRDVVFQCPTGLWASTSVLAGISNVYRYIYGAVFPELQAFPGAGAWHSSEIAPFFGTYNRTTASPSQVTLSNTFQTIISNFIKEPTTPPANNWARYVQGGLTPSVAKLAYKGNVNLDDVVQPATIISVDGPCVALWNQVIALLTLRSVLQL
uniref:Carboxylic ester hydrolase n=1 Tax=Moniliophthora roreri TaxID=221103 RepID=A0A0W0G2D3_MONRR